MAERIENLRKDHLDECALLLASVFSAEPWNANYTFDTAKKELAWTLNVSGFVGLVTLDEGLVAFTVGYIEQDDEREIFCLKTLCVRPDAQSKGVGSRLMQRLKEKLEKMGVNLIYLTTHRGTPAESFYKKIGYKVSDEDVLMIHEW
jgi:aminoglycoside 6'-N-acetyltransferase I